MSASLLAASGLLGAAMFSVGGMLPAQAATAAPAAPADYAPGFNDVVGVGSDTLQFIIDFGLDGDVSGDTGYNDAGNLYKAVSFDATADSNARAAYLNNSNDTTLLPLNPTVVLRGGTFPVQRPNGSGAGINALLADTAPADPSINFVRMSSAPSSANGATAVTNGWGGLQEFVLGNENLQVAAANTTNAPNGLSAQQLVAIYQCTDTKWNQVGGTSTDTIIPVIPQNGSGTRKTFLADLQTANGGTAITLGSCVTTGEENDPTGITGQAATTASPGGPADAIEPFSGSRLNLWLGKSGNTTFGSDPSSGYFHDPTVAYPGGSALAPGIHLLTGAPSDSNPVYDDVRSLYIVYRWSDQTSTTAWQPGGTLNWAQTLFCDPGGPTPFFQTPAGKTLIAEAGANPATQSCLTTPLT
jgi:ABC-type phosphate transport system substrate-binding protein